MQANNLKQKGNTGSKRKKAGVQVCANDSCSSNCLTALLHSYCGGTDHWDTEVLDRKQVHGELAWRRTHRRTDKPKTLLLLLCSV